MEFPPWPYYENDEIKAVEKVLKSGKVNKWTGNITEEFEKDFSSLFNIKHSIAVANGTLALDVAYRSLGLCSGDEIITTPRTFIATSSSLMMLGAKPVFADVELDTGNLSIKSIEKNITSKTKAISIVHISGWPADMVNLVKLAESYNLHIIEDCSQAHGAAIRINKTFRSVGSFSDVATWSFCQDKIISTGGEGGMVTTNSRKIWEYIWSFKDHGKDFNTLTKNKNQTGFKWLHENEGSNYRLTEMQSAIGRIQLMKLDNWINIRSRNASILIEILGQLNSIRIPIPPSNIKHSWYKFHCYLNQDSLKSDWNREKIINAINNKGYPAFFGSCSEIYLEKRFTKFGLSPTNRLPIAKELGETSLMFLVHPTINEEKMNDYANAIKSVLEIASK